MANDVTKLITTLRASGVLDDPKLRKRIAQYSTIQRDLQTTPDVTQAPDFQRQFRAFYRVRRDAAWQRVFFEFMQRHRRSAPDFRQSLFALAHQTDRCEASFASKLEFFEQEMMRSRLQPPKQASLCAIAAALMLSFLLPGPAAGVTQRYCSTKPHSGRHDGSVGRRGPQMCRIDMAPQQAQGVGAAARRRGHGISIELGAPSPN